MKALLLAGGYGSRLRPITNSIPKCLVKIKSKPLLDYWLEASIDKLGCNSVVINTHYLADQVCDHIADSKYSNKVTLVHEETLLGTLNTVKNNLPMFQTEDLLLAHADNYCVTDWQNFLNCFEQRNAQIHMTMMTFNCETPKSCGMVKLDGLGRIVEYIEKPDFEYSGSRANGAVFLLDAMARHSIASMPEHCSDLCKDFLPAYLNHINCFHNSHVHIDIGTPEKLAFANELNVIEP